MSAFRPSQIRECMLRWYFAESNNIEARIFSSIVRYSKAPNRVMDFLVEGLGFGGQGLISQRGSRSLRVGFPMITPKAPYILPV